MTDLDTLFADPRTLAVLRRAIAEGRMRKAGYDPGLPVSDAALVWVETS